MTAPVGIRVAPAGRRDQCPDPRPSRPASSAGSAPRPPPLLPTARLKGVRRAPNRSPTLPMQPGKPLVGESMASCPCPTVRSDASSSSRTDSSNHDTLRPALPATAPRTVTPVRPHHRTTGRFRSASSSPYRGRCYPHSNTRSALQCGSSTLAPTSTPFRGQRVFFIGRSTSADPRQHNSALSSGGRCAVHDNRGLPPGVIARLRR